MTVYSGSKFHSCLADGSVPGDAAGPSPMPAVPQFPHLEIAARGNGFPHVFGRAIPGKLGVSLSRLFIVNGLLIGFCAAWQWVICPRVCVGMAPAPVCLHPGGKSPQNPAWDPQGLVALESSSCVSIMMMS